MAVENTDIQIKDKVSAIIQENEYKPLSLKDLLKNVKIMYNKKNDTYIIELNSNIAIKADNIVTISKNDTILVSGDSLGISKGIISLNPKIK